LLGYLLLIALGAVCLILGVRPVGDQSAWLHLSIGRQLIGGGGFGRVDPWVPWAAQPSIPTEWLPDVAAYKLHELFGLSGIAWLRGAGHALTARPQLLGFVLLSLAVVAWWQMASDLRPRWWLVPLTWVWASSHGLWVVGVGFGVVTIAGLALDRRLTWGSARRLCAVPALSLGTAALTPIGPALLLTPLTVGRDVRDFVGEWQASSAHDLATFVTLCMLGLVALSWALVATAPGWDTILGRSGATWALVLTDSPLAAALHKRESWATVGTDDGYSLMRRPG